MPCVLSGVIKYDLRRKVASMENSTPRPDTINSLRFGADAALAMQAGRPLEVFTPLPNGSMTTEQIADAMAIERDDFDAAA